MTIIVGVIGALATVAAAGVSAHFGAKKGLEQYKRQRAFDTRLDWYKRAVETLNDSQSRLKKASLLLSGAPLPPGMTIEDTATEALEAVQNAVAIGIEAKLFATEASVETIRRAAAKMPAKSKVTSQPQEMSKLFNTIADNLGEAMNELAAEGRAEMPW